MRVSSASCALTDLTLWLLEGFFLKAHMNLTGFLSFGARTCSPASLRAHPRLC